MKLRKRYTIEYIDNKHDMELAETAQNPWEYFKTKVFEEPKAKEVYTGEKSLDAEAWKTYLLWAICPDQIYLSNANNVTHPLFCQMWMELLDEDDKVVYEDYCELPGTIRNTIFTAVNNQANKERDSARETVNALQKELALCKSFIKKYNAEKAFSDFIKE